MTSHPTIPPVAAPGGLAGAPITQDVVTIPRRMEPALRINIVGLTRDQLRDALTVGCTRVLIDDFDAASRREAVRIARDEFGGRIPLEVSGGVDMTTLRGIAEDGVDYISIGGLTKHVHAVDLSMKLGPPPSTAR